MATTNHPQAIAEVVFRHYIETGQGADVKTIAARCGISESTIRKHVDRAPGVVPEAEYRQSRTYHFESDRQHKVWVYYPTRERMRQEIIREKKEV